MKLTFTLPWSDPPLRSNKRLHHMAEHRKKKDIVLAGLIAGTDALHRLDWSIFPISTPIQVCMIWSVPTRHVRDADAGQPTLKSYQDGLVSAGIIASDRHEIVRRSFCEIEYAPNQPMSLRVEIEAI